MAHAEIPFVVYDCFTDTRFGGNVGGIVLDAAALSDQQMQSIAKEINAPVTGFITGQDGSIVAARFFMPTSEIAMCGHVTIGLFTHLAAQCDDKHHKFTLKTQAGDVPVDVVRGGDGLHTVMMALALPKPLGVAPDLGELADALAVSQGQLQSVGAADAGLKHLFVPMASEADLQSLTPDFAKLTTLSNRLGVHTVACFAMSGSNASKTLSIRDFCPAVGVNETPASGTTNGALTGYLVAQGLVSASSQRIVAHQGQSIDRPSVIVSEIEVENGSIVSLKVGGQAVRSYSGVFDPL